MQRRTREKANRKKLNYRQRADDSSIDRWTLKSFLEFSGEDSSAESLQLILRELGSSESKLTSFQFHSYLFSNIWDA